MTIKWLNSDPMQDLAEANLSTIRKHPKTKITPEKFSKLLRSEHSTLRFLSLVVHDEDCPYTVACQIVRSTKEHTQPEMSSGRPDWNGGKERDYTQSRWLHVKFTPIGLIRMMEDRLCMRAEKETREWAGRLHIKICMHNDKYIREMGNFSLPTCITKNYCREGLNCHGVIK